MFTKVECEFTGWTGRIANWILPNGKEWTTTISTNSQPEDGTFRSAGTRTRVVLIQGERYMVSVPTNVLK